MDNKDINNQKMGNQKMNNQNINNQKTDNQNRKAVDIYSLVMSSVMGYLGHFYVVFVSSHEVQVKEQLIDADGNAYEDLIYQKKTSDNQQFDVNKAINLIPDYIVWYTENTYGIGDNNGEEV